MMGSDYTFIYERTSTRRIITLFFFLLGFIVLGTLFLSLDIPLASIASVPAINQTYHFFEKDVVALNPLGIFYITVAGDLFFNPIPPELFFYAALVKGVSPWLLLIASFAGIILANTFNYVVGRRFSLFFMYFMSKKNVYKVRRYVNRYGAYAVVIFNILPLPAPLLTFALGMARYNPWRLFTALVIGSVIKYAIMLGFHYAVF